MAVKITYFKGKEPTRIVVNINGRIFHCKYADNFFSPIIDRHSEMVDLLHDELPMIFEANDCNFLQQIFGRRIYGAWPELGIKDQIKLFKLIDLIQKEF